MKINLLRLAIVLIFICSSYQSKAQEQFSHVMKIGIGNRAQDNNFGWTPFEVLKNKAEAFSGGRLKVELYAEFMGQSSLEMIGMVRDGVLSARDFAGGHLATVYPPLQVLSIPYLFAEREIAWKVLDGPFGRHLIESMTKETGLRPLYWIENGGFRHYSNNKRPIHSPTDMKGLRIRTMESPLHLKIVRDLGARGVAIQWQDVYSAIESGLVDGQENSINTFLIPHFENIQQFITLDGHVYGLYTLLMNDAWYQTLPDDLKVALERAKRLSIISNRGLSVVNEKDNMKYLQEKNVQIYMPSPEEMEQFKQRTRASAISWLEKNVGKKWVEMALQATRQAEKELGYVK